jgi:hypothetical protein|tara:strand:- start:255 stop:494 length:240 start_codon:yes stop_codon:yes gene_type:complete
MISFIIHQAIGLLLRQARKKGAPQEVEFLLKDGMEMFVDVTLAVRDGKFTATEKSEIRKQLVHFTESSVDMFDSIPVSD